MKHIIDWHFVVVDEEEQIMEIHLFDNECDLNVKVELDDEVDGIDLLCEDITFFIAEHHPNLKVEIKNDGDYLGIIVDIWDDVECLDTRAFWFDDYIREEEY